jgi:hypothetical protein
MVRQWIKMASISLASVVLFSCAGETEIQLDVSVKLDGKPVDQARVTVDGVKEGLTGQDGSLSMRIKRKPGTEVSLSVEKQAPGYRIEPWKESFVVKEPGEGVDKYSFDVSLNATKFLTIVAKEKQGPVEGAVIKVKGKEVGRTDSDGSYEYVFTTLPKKGLNIAVTKKGYSRWKKTVKVKPGDTVEATLYRQIALIVKAVTDDYGQTKAVPGVSVSINGKVAGKTNNNGMLKYKYMGKPGRKASVELTAPGYIPEVWTSTVVLSGAPVVHRFFYPSTPKPIRAGIYGYMSNTPDEPLEAVRARIEEALGNRLFSYLSFTQVPRENLLKRMEKSKLNIDTLTTEGWQKTGLIRFVDMIILGSVIKDDRGLTFETKVYTSNGKLLLSQINTVKKQSHIKKVAKKIADNIIEQFPFEGAVAAAEGERYKINLGRNDYGMSRGMEFDLLVAELDKSGMVKGYGNIGALKINKTGRDESWAEAAELKQGQTVSVGDKVVRRIISVEEAKGAKTSFILSAKGGLPPDLTPLPSVNIYINGSWAGTTDSSGKASIPARLGKRHDIVLYRHGYEKVTDEVYLKKDGEAREFTLSVNNSLFKVDSVPSGAEVFIDEEGIGRTPLLEGEQVNFGFHKLKLAAGEDYRDWEEVVEFNKKVLDLTGRNRIRLFKDHMKIGRRAEESGNIDAAIDTYRSVEKGHPDYSNVRHRLGQLYMDEKQDYDSAIREFEGILSLPENRELLYKQFSVAYTNLGHAYYEKGNELIKTDRNAAAENFANAIKNLEVAKQNTRFFPSNIYDEAVHDTYYYTAISYHKLYLVTKKPSLLDKADLAWRKYFDFFPKKLESDSNFVQFHDSARKYWTQIKDLM